MSGESAEDASARGSVAIICFMPDYGHAQPLLKIADALAAAGFDIHCYLAQECSPLMDRFRFPCTLLENAGLAQRSRELRRIFSGSLFFNRACLYLYYLLCYPQVADVAGRAAQRLKDGLCVQSPGVIICDQDWFTGWYSLIAASLDLPLIMNSHDGSLAYNQRAFVQIYGFSGHSAAWQRVVEIATAASTKLCAAYYRLRYLHSWLELRARRRAADAAFAAAFPVAPDASVATQRIFVGSAKIERERLPHLVNTHGAGQREFPPLRFGSRLPLSRPLREWIEQDRARPIVYVSFGSAVTIDRKFASAIHEGLRGVPARVLWSLPADQQPLLSHLAPAPNIRFEPFVAQPELLEVETVRCFVTQAGPWSVQEALFGGTPMLCIPFFADQAYNSSVVEQLGAGIRLWRRRISARSIEGAVCEILEDDGYRRRVGEISGELHRRDGSEALARFVAACLRPRGGKAG